MLVSPVLWWCCQGKLHLWAQLYCRYTRKQINKETNSLSLSLSHTHTQNKLKELFHKITKHLQLMDKRKSPHSAQDASPVKYLHYIYQHLSHDFLLRGVFVVCAWQQAPLPGQLSWSTCKSNNMMDFFLKYFFYMELTMYYGIIE